MYVFAVVELACKVAVAELPDATERVDCSVQVATPQDVAKLKISVPQFASLFVTVTV